MNILITNYEYPPIGAGGANASWNLAKTLAGKGHTITVLTAGYKNIRGLSIEDGVTVYRCGAVRKKKESSNLFEMFTFVVSALIYLPNIRKWNMDIHLVFFSFPCGPLGFACRILFNLPYVVLLRGGDVPGTEARLKTIHFLLSPVRWVIYRYSHAVVANSPGLKDLAEKGDAVNVSFIPNGIDTCQFSPKTDYSETGVFRFLFVGRFQPQKNLFFTLALLNDFHHENGYPFEFHLVGDGPQRDDLMDFSSTLGIANRIVWHPWCSIEDLVFHYRQADCLLNLSLYEGMPNTVLEAMACGLPVVASDVIGNRSVIRHSETGFLCSLKDRGQLFDCLSKMILDRRERQRLGEKSRRWVKERYSWESAALQLLDLISG